MRDLVSIIVPVYNAAKYLEKTIQSITAQTYKRIEVLLVDDGSVDESMLIARRLAKVDSRIKYFQKKHEGVTLARKFGVKESAGSWIMFVDADDTLPRDAVEYLMGLVCNETIDLVLATWNDIGPSTKRKGFVLLKGYITSDEYIHALLIGDAPIGILGKVIRKQALLESRALEDIPSEITNHEDLLMNIKLAKSLRYIRVSPTHAVYNYIRHENSASQKGSSVCVWDKFFQVLEDILPAGYEKKYQDFIVAKMARLAIKFPDLDFRASTFYPSFSKQKISCSGRFFLRYIQNPTKWNLFMVRFLLLMRKIRKLVRYTVEYYGK